MEKKGKKLRNLWAPLGGTAIGFINGFFGGGGGMLCVPLLDKVLKEETKTAHATAILIILPISIVSAVIYIIGGHFMWQPALITSAGVVAGGVGGAFLLKVLPPKAVGLVFSLVMITAGVYMMVRS